MSSDDLMPLPPDMQSLLFDEKAAPPMPASLQAKIGERLADSLSQLPADADVNPGDASAGDQGLADALPGAPGVADLSPLASLAAKPVLLATSAFAIGLGAGVGGTVYYSSTPPPLPSKPQPALVQIVDAGVEAMPKPDAEPLRAVMDAAPVVLKPPSGPPAEPARHRLSKDDALAVERSLLELARTAITRGDAPTALLQLARHSRTYPRGRLSEERDALWVQALVLNRSYAKAKAKAKAFKKRYPKSLFLPVVDHVLRDVP